MARARASDVSWRGEEGGGGGKRVGREGGERVGERVGEVVGCVGKCERCIKGCQRKCLESVNEFIGVHWDVEDCLSMIEYDDDNDGWMHGAYSRSALLRLSSVYARGYYSAVTPPRIF